MGHDKTPERNNLIFFYTMLSVATLVALAFIFNSYFVALSEGEVNDKLSQPADELEQVRSSQLEDLRSGPVPVDRAMKVVAGRERAPAVTPAPSGDLGALEGWNQARLKPVVPPALLEAAPADGGADGGPIDADGGVAAAGNNSDTLPSTPDQNAPNQGDQGAGSGQQTGSTGDSEE